MDLVIQKEGQRTAVLVAESPSRLVVYALVDYADKARQDAYPVLSFGKIFCDNFELTKFLAYPLHHGLSFPTQLVFDQPHRSYFCRHASRLLNQRIAVHSAG